MRKKEKFLLIDTETANTLDDPLCYDVGGIIFDRDGLVYETFSFVTYEIYTDRRLMNTTYYKEKLPAYEEDLKNGNRKMCRFSTIYHRVNEYIKKYNIKKVIAHNMRFDYKAIHTTERFLTCSKYRFFFPHDIEYWDTLKMARETFKEDKNYIAFCEENGFLNSYKKPRYTAEVIHKYLTKDLTFKEAHKGLEDAYIEKEIFLYCLRRNRKINGKLWA